MVGFGHETHYFLLIICILSFAMETESLSSNDKRANESDEENEDQSANKRTKTVGVLFGPVYQEMASKFRTHGYKFNEDGEFVSADDQETRFVYDVYNGNKKKNEARYVRIGENVTDFIYDLLEHEMKLTKVSIPVDAEQDEATSFFFMSQDALSNPDKLALIIHGSGFVRAGQWARKLIINENLTVGSQLPYVRRVLDEGYGVMVLNTNQNHVEKDEERVRVRGSENPIEHGLYVLDNFVRKAAAKNIAVIAHSFGGIVTYSVLKKNAEIRDRVFAIALTDSVHSPFNRVYKSDYEKWALKVSRNWVTSREPLDTHLILGRSSEPNRYSAGTTEHERTSWSCYEPLFTFIADMYEKRLSDKESTGDNSAAGDNLSPSPSPEDLTKKRDDEL